MRPAAALIFAIAAAAPARAQCWRGAWEPAFDHDMAGFTHLPADGKFNAVHLALIPKGHNQGRLLIWDHDEGRTNPADLQRWAIVDPGYGGAPPQFENGELLLPGGMGDLFCAGHGWTAAGDLFVAGGTTLYPVPGNPQFLGGKLAYLYRPAAGPTGTWLRQPDLEQARWYPSVTLLANDQLLVTGGTPDTLGPDWNDYEAFDAAGGAWQQNGATQVFPGPLSPAGVLGQYPRLHLLSTGEVFLSGMFGYSSRMRHELAPGVWTPMAPGTWDMYEYGSSVLVPGYRDLALRIGGEGRILGFPFGPTDVVEYVQSSAPGSPGWDWQPAPYLNQARMHANAVLLPDGGILVLGGRTNSWQLPQASFTRTPEYFRPDLSTWVDLPAEASVRGYHATACLLPDGRVLSAGGDARTLDYQVYRPWYLTCGGARPVIQGVSASTWSYAARYFADHAALPGGRFVENAVLMRPASLTHHSDFDQLYVELRVVSRTATRIRFDAPRSSAHAPRGYYMLFLVSDAGVPSAASWIRLQ